MKWLALLLCSVAAFGQSTIRGSGSLSGSGQVFVFSPTSVLVIPATAGNAVGNTVQFTAQFIDASGNTAPACASSGWASGSPGIATINASTGLATGVSIGTADITCTALALVGHGKFVVESSPVFTNPATPCTQPCALLGGVVGQAYSVQLAVSGGTPPYNYTLTAGALPIGLNLTIGGLISGAPAATGIATFSIKPCDSLGTCSSALSMSIQIVGAGPNGPNTWVNSHEMDGGQTAFTTDIVTDNTITFPASGSGGSWTCNVTNYGPYTGNSQASLQQAMTDMEQCRTVNNHSVKLILPAGSVFSAGAGLTVPQSNSVQNTKPLIIVSSADHSLPNGTIACVKGIQDNLATSTDVYIRNSNCTGGSMSYQLGTTVATIPPGAFSLANGTATNTSAYNDVANLWAVEATTLNQFVFKFCSPVGGGQEPQCTGTTIGPDHWIIADGEVRDPVGSTTGNVILSVTESGNETSTSQFSTHIHFRHMWVHGDWTTLQAGSNQITGNLKISACVYCSLEDSYTSQALRPGAEGHALGMLYGNTIKVVHNVFEGNSSSLFCGGFASPVAIPGYNPCFDMQIGRNRMTFPYEWIGVLTIPAGNAHFTGQSIVRKNTDEYKTGQRVVMYGNIHENSDNSGGQGGVLGPQLNVRNTSAGNIGSNYQMSISDWFVYGNIYRNSCEGNTLSATSAPAGNDGGGVAFQFTRISILDNLYYNVDTANPGCAHANKTGIQITKTPTTWQATITEDPTGTFATAVMTCTKASAGNCPAGPPPIGYQVTDMVIGQPVSVYGCTGVTAFNTPANPDGFALPSTALGSPALPGTITNGLTVVYAVATTPNAVDSTGNCTISNQQGYPLFFVWQHNTVLQQTNNTSLTQDGIANGAYFAQNGLVRDNILTGLGWNSSTTEGTKTEKFFWDSQNSLTADHNVWTSRTASKYTEYGNNPNYPDVAGCTGAGCTPPITEMFPATGNCSTNTPDPTCVGFLGGMSNALMPIVFTDYHQIRLCTVSDAACNNTPSVYSAGGASPASDGTDRGANLSIIDTEQTQNPFVCPSQLTCTGSPFPD